MKKLIALVLALAMLSSLFVLAGTAEETKEIPTVTPGVHTVEEFDPDPFLDALDKHGLPRSESHSPVLVD